MLEKIVIKNFPLDTKIMGVMLLESITQGETKQKTSFLTLGLTDGKEKIEAKYWNCSKDNFEIPEQSLIGVELYAKNYMDAKSFEVTRYTKMPDYCGYTVSDFVVKPPIPAEDMYNFILCTVCSTAENGVCDSVVSIVRYLYDKNKEKLMYWSAAERVHHNLYSGLLYHTFRMLQLAMVAVKVYPCANPQLLLCAVALHDIGKLEELETSSLGSAKYTVDGNLFGHTALGLRMIDKAAEYLNIPDEETRDLRHCIAAHHGKTEWGAVAKPATIEAYLLHEIDMIDSRVYQFEDIYNNTEPGEVSDRIFGLDNTKIYHSELFHGSI